MIFKGALHSCKVVLLDSRNTLFAMPALQMGTQTLLSKLYSIPQHDIKVNLGGGGGDAQGAGALPSASGSHYYHSLKFQAHSHPKH